MVFFRTADAPLLQIVVHVQANHSFELNQIFFVNFENDSFSVLVEVDSKQVLLFPLVLNRKRVAFSAYFALDLLQVVLLHVLIFAHVGFG